MRSRVRVMVVGSEPLAAIEVRAIVDVLFVGGGGEAYR